MTNSSKAQPDDEATFTAQDYAELGFAPIRLYGVNADGSCGCGGGEKCARARRVGKHPIGNGWQNAPIVAKAVDKHIARGGNVGLRMGDQPSGARYVALDEDAEGALAKGEELWGPLPETLTSRTGSGGRHCIYEWPAGTPYPSNKVRSNGLKFDVRGQNSQIVVAPSRNASGPYSWTRFDVPAPLPAAWVAALLANSGQRTGPRKAGKMPLERLSVADPDERTAALVDALAPFWEAPGEATGRRHRLRALGGYLARRGWPDEQIAAFVRALPTERPESERVSLAIECAQQARSGDDNAAGWTNLQEWSPDAAAVIESVAKDPREPDGFVGVWVPAFAKMFERAAEAHAQAETPANDAAETFAPAADNAPSVPLILRSKRGQVLTLLWEGDELGHRPLAEKNLRLRIKELGYDHSMIPLFAKGGKPHSTDRLVEEHGATYAHTAYAFANRVTIYDPTGEGRVVIGYPLATMPGRFDADADAWLRALGGTHHDRLAVWIASCSQANINRLSACLIVMGRADSGKSLLGQAVARMWGQAPPALGLIAAQFNADLLRCPILVDEEAQLLGSKELSTKRFRDVIQSSARSVEFKGLERSELYGGLRAVVSCNGYSDLRFKDLGGPAVIEALRDRMLVINATDRTDACKAPLARLRPDPHDHRVDLERVAGHLAWLCETVSLPAERFLGAGGDETEAAILSSLTEEHAELWETLRDWLESDGTAGAWSARLGLLCANPAALATSLQHAGRGWDLPRVRAALAPFVKLKDYQPRDGGARPRLWALDGERVAESLGLGAEARGALSAKLDASERPAQPRHRGRFGSVR